jgi:DNA helicase HerA-like ATPase
MAVGLTTIVTSVIELLFAWATTGAIRKKEAHRAAKLRLIPAMAKECRKYGISLVLASQEAKDFNISLFSAVANYLVLRLN